MKLFLLPLLQNLTLSQHVHFRFNHRNLLPVFNSSWAQACDCSAICLTQFAPQTIKCI